MRSSQRHLVLIIVAALLCASLTQHTAATASTARAGTETSAQAAQLAAPVLARSCRDHVAEGWETVEGGMLELEVHGCGVKPWKIYAAYYPWPPRWVCNYEFELFGIGRDGRHWESGPVISKCGFRPWVKWERPFEFKNNTLLCARGGVHGQGWSPYYACLRMKA